jgi:hypothetical protein
VQPETNHACTIVCYDPLWYDATPQVVALPAPGVFVALPVGSALTRKLRV